MGKLELSAGQDNVIIRNQEVYGFLPKDVIDRLGNTSLQLTTQDQTALGAINEINSSLTEKGDWVLLKELTTANTEYTLDYAINNFKTIVVVSYYSGFILNSIEYPTSDLVGKYIICCYNDGTIRKGQFEVVSTTKVKTSGGSGSSGWQNITKIELYGVK